MCGIAGEIRWDGREADIGAVARMTDQQVPRGPDAGGLYAQGQIAVGHRRLKIVDLSDHAQQPMIDPDLGLGIVFNGMIYNYQAMRSELEARGYRFFSHGDTEVLLKAYHAYGPGFVERLHGMFAFAIWSRDSSDVLFGRDRLGIKPLYLAPQGGGLRFASSLPALLAAGGVDTSIDPVALHHYMHFHAVVPAPYTLFEGVRKLPPATLLAVDAEGRQRQWEYWRPGFTRQPGDEARSFEDWVDVTEAALRKAVDRRLVADVPVGVLLSGGVDSSLIVGMLAEAGQKGLATFSIGFESIGEEAGDEFRYSDLVAQRFATDHHQIRIDAAETRRHLPACIKAMNEPMVSHDNIGFYLLSREVSRHVKVVQSGQGADEVFAGYHWYPPLVTSNKPVGDYARVFCDRDEGEYREAVDARFHGASHSRETIAAAFAAPGAETAVDKALRLDTTTMLVDDPVKRVDSMTMAWGLEARVPFLDHELVEMAARIPPRHKLSDDGKGVLKAVARRVVPKEVIDRPKGYFPVPALKYLRGSLLDDVRDALTGQAARERRLFSPAYVETLLADPEAHITPLRGSKLWQLGLLEMWLQTHGV